MNGDYTKVPLRRDERWTGARMQEGRVLLDHEWNLNLDAAARASSELAADAIGSAGVAAGSDAFEVGVTTAGDLDLTLESGRMWVGGLAAFAPARFGYGDQDQIAPLPASGTVLVYLDVFEEHVQPAEDPLELVDPALAPIDSAARTRVGYRVRAAPTDATSCAAAWDTLATVAESAGRVTIARTGAVTPTDPCDPPGDPLTEVPDGLFRVEVLDGGTESTTRFAWSFEDGGTAISVASITGAKVTLAPAMASLAVGDLVEVSWLARRADRAPYGPLYAVEAVEAAPGGAVLTLDRAVSAPGSATGLAVRRWDGEAVGAATEVTASYRGDDLGIRFAAAAGEYEAGDWWGARLRSELGDGIEHRSDVGPDGTVHAFAPLALVDLDARTVVSDCRPKFTPLADLDPDRGCCTVSVKPGDDLQAAADALPATGGELCFAAGVYELEQPLQLANRSRIVLNGAGPATILRALRREAAVAFDTCDEIEVRHLRAEGGTPGAPPGDPHLEGAITFVACRNVVVADCVATCPDSAGKAQTCITVRSSEGVESFDRVRIERNRLEVGALQTGALVIDASQVTIDGNQVVLGPPPPREQVLNAAFGRELARRLQEALRPAGSEGAVAVKVPGVRGGLHVSEETEPLALLHDFASSTSAAEVRKAGGGEKALLSWARALGAGRGLEKLSPKTLAGLHAAAARLRAGGQGIVVGGERVGVVQVCGNIVEGFIQGIHVGVSQASQDTRRRVDSVLLARNLVLVAVPLDYNRDRHGIFVGNARSIHVLETVAFLHRLKPVSGPVRAPVGRPVAEPVGTPVEGIRIHGELGEFLVVRNSSLHGFTIGVRVVPLDPLPEPRVWLVSETMAQGANTALDAPPAVDRERNAP